MEEHKNGTLYLVGTPIGNLGDITLRALETLKNVDLIAAEDTRQTQKLLTHFAIRKPVTSYYEHNKRSKGAAVIEELLQGKNVALVSDAGMPGISDPGSDLVSECIEKEIEIVVIPGPSAVLAGLVASGLNTKGFVFAGFFPRHAKEKKKLLEELSQDVKTIVFYESPHRLCSTLKDICNNWGDRRCCVAREITKIYEEYKRGSLSEILQFYNEKNIKGEITLIIEGYKKEKAVLSWDEIEECVSERVIQGLSRKEAIKEVAGEYGVSKRELYNRIMR